MTITALAQPASALACVRRQGRSSRAARHPRRPSRAAHSRQSRAHWRIPVACMPMGALTFQLPALLVVHSPAAAAAAAAAGCVWASLVNAQKPGRHCISHCHDGHKACKEMARVRRNTSIVSRNQPMLVTDDRSSLVTFLSWASPIVSSMLTT